MAFPARISYCFLERAPALALHNPARQQVGVDIARDMPRRLQAGAIAFRFRGRRTEFLLVSRRNSHREWLFPKGNVETDDSMEETALKELREEAGAEGVILTRIGRLMRGTSGDRVSITYYLVHSGFTRPNGEGRKVKWLTLREAEALLSDRGSRALLRRAAAEIG